MRRANKSRAVLASAMIAAFVALAPFASSYALGTRQAALPASGLLTGSSAGNTIELSSSVSPWLRLASVYGRVPQDKMMTISVSLRLRNVGGLEAFLSQVYNPRSPRFRHFLTPSEFLARFGPPMAAERRVENWLVLKRLKVLRVASNRAQIVARAPASIVASALDTRIDRYRLNGRSVFANSTPVRLPHSVFSDVIAVTGLSDIAKQRPSGGTLRLKPRQARIRGYSPSDLASIYDLNPLFARGLNGKGATIAIAAFADYNAKHVSTFNHAFNLLGTVQRVKVDDGLTIGATLGGPDQVETEADIELARETAPGARELVYEAENSDTGTLALYNQLVSDDKAQVISNSWGQYEDSWDQLAAIHQTLQQAAAQGQTFVTASGDNGAYDEAACCPQGDPSKLAVDYPASDPLATGVGGTSLQGTCSSGYGKEVVWAEPSQGVGSGGGLSDQFKRPDYQVGPGVSNQYSNGMRQVPDVSIDANPNTGYAVYTLGNASSEWGVLGGTSPGAPLWSGLAALSDQASGHSLGAWNTLLYSIAQKSANLKPSPFHDVTAGNNLHYPATAGWDFATGWGSFDAAALVGTITGTSYAPTSGPWLALASLAIYRELNGKQVITTRVRQSDKLLFAAQYQGGNVCSIKTTGKLLIRRGGHTLHSYKLSPLSQLPDAGIGAAISLSDARFSGKLVARFVLKLGSATAQKDETFRALKG